MRRKRYQEGSLQIRSHGKRKMWVVLYREGGARKYNTLGLFSKMSKSEAQKKQAEFMGEINAAQAVAPNPDITFGDYLDNVALPFLRKKWKRSTASTSENRMTHHLEEFRETRLQAITLKALQAFLGRKAAEDCRAAWWSIFAGIYILCSSWHWQKATRNGTRPLPSLPRGKRKRNQPAS